MAQILTQDPNSHQVNRQPKNSNSLNLNQVLQVNSGKENFFDFYNQGSTANGRRKASVTSSGRSEPRLSGSSQDKSTASLEGAKFSSDNFGYICTAESSVPYSIKDGLGKINRDGVTADFTSTRALLQAQWKIYGLAAL